MERTGTQEGVRVLSLPALVEESVLARVELELRRAPEGRVAVLDFTFVRHIRYRDLQRFTRAVADAGLWPVRLVGLSDYCREIFRFALSLRDWESVFELDGDWSRAVARGSAARRGSTLGYRRVRAAGDGIPGGLPVPSPN
jgi:hypothetical protein